MLKLLTRQSGWRFVYAVMAVGGSERPLAQNGAKMVITREEIKNLLKEEIEPLERKIDNLNNGFQEVKRLVDFVNEKYDDILVQLKQANEKIQIQGSSVKQMRKDLDDATKEAPDAMNGFENLVEYLSRDCLEISGVPPSEDYTCNQLVMAVGQAIGVQVKEEDTGKY